MVIERRSPGRLFQMSGAATRKLRRPSRVLVRGTNILPRPTGMALLCHRRLPSKKLGSIRPGVSALHIGKIYTPPVRNLLRFFGTWTRLQASPLDRFFTLNTSNDAVCARKCLLLLQNINLIFYLFIQKIRNKLQWRLWEKFKNSLNCHITSVVCKIES